MSADYIKSLEKANEEYQNKLAYAEKLINSYKQVEFFVVPVYSNKHIKQIILKMSFCDIGNSMDIAWLTKPKDKDLWKFRKMDLKEEFHKIESNKPLEYYITYLMELLDLTNIPYTIVKNE